MAKELGIRIIREDGEVFISIGNRKYPAFKTYDPDGTTYLWDHNWENLQSITKE
jgi:hypothetical protein